MNVLFNLKRKGKKLQQKKQQQQQNSLKKNLTWKDPVFEAA